MKLTSGRGGERVIGPTLFDGFDPLQPESPPPAEPAPAVVSAPGKRKGRGRRPTPADLPRRPEVIDLSDAVKVCPCCHATKVRTGPVASERLDDQPMALFVRESIRPTHAGRGCESQGRDPQIVRASLPPEPTPKGGGGRGSLAHVVVARAVDHLPLHRQEAILARYGRDVRRSTPCDHLRTCGERRPPPYDRVRQRLLRSSAIHADDTPLVLLRPRRAADARVHPGDAATPYTLFDLTAGRRQELPQRSLAGDRGLVHADADAGPNAVQDNIRRLGCWTHARRHSPDAQPGRPAGGRGAGLHPHPVRRRTRDPGRA